MGSQSSASDHVLDAGAFYAGIPFLSSAGRYYTTGAVFEEVKHIKRSHAAIEALLDSGNLRVADAGKPNIEKATAAAKKTGDHAKLSKADLSVIALALELDATLVTDDYAAANVASFLKIPVASTSTKGIKEQRRWIAYCSACSRTFDPNSTECPLCGNRLKRKYKKVVT